MEHAKAVKGLGSNPNFIRPGDTKLNASHMGGLSNRNFVSREAGDIAAAETEARTGVVVRRPGESTRSFEKRFKDAARANAGKRQRACIPPSIARRELAQLEKKWESKIPRTEMLEGETLSEAEKYAPEFDYMNDCRYALGMPDVDYMQPREATTDATVERYVAFKVLPERERLAAIPQSTDLPLMRIVSIHDTSEKVKDAAARRMETLWAEKSAAKGE